MGRRDPSQSSVRHLPSYIGDTLDALLQGSLAPSSRLHYARSWKKFSCFCTLVGSMADLPISVSLLLWFIAHLFAGGAAPASIISVVAARSYFNKVNGFADPAKNFVVAKALAGARGMRSRFGRLVHALLIVFSCRYTCIIMKAMMVLAFAAFLRVGEMVPCTLSNDAHCLHPPLIKGKVCTCHTRLGGFPSPMLIK